MLVLEPKTLVYVVRVRKELICLHGFLMVSNYLQFSRRIKTEALKQSFVFVGMLVYQFVILQVAENVFYMPKYDTVVSLDTCAVLMWFHIELVFWAGIIGSNMLFLALRSCTKHKILMDGYIDETEKLAQIDTIVATKRICDSFHTEVVPWIVSNYLHFLAPKDMNPLKILYT